jgi:hypothetical protein
MTGPLSACSGTSKSASTNASVAGVSTIRALLMVVIAAACVNALANGATVGLSSTTATKALIVHRVTVQLPARRGNRKVAPGVIAT